MLGECNGFECWPICVSVEPVGPCGFALVPFFLPSADYAGVVVTDWVKTV